MDIHEAKKLIDDRGIVIVDIRDEESFKEAHIPNAIPLNDETIEKFIQTTDKNASILCCCYHGFSSQSAAAFLKEQGFKNVESLDGGFEAWRVTYPFESLVI